MNERLLSLAASITDAANEIDNLLPGYCGWCRHEISDIPEIERQLLLAKKAAEQIKAVVLAAEKQAAENETLNARQRVATYPARRK